MISGSYSLICAAKASNISSSSVNEKTVVIEGSYSSVGDGKGEREVQRGWSSYSNIKTVWIIFAENISKAQTPIVIIESRFGSGKSHSPVSGFKYGVASMS